MARAIRGRKRIWERPLATCLPSKLLNSEEDDIIVDDEENVKDGNMYVDQTATEKVQSNDGETSRLFESEVELNEVYKELLIKAVAERLKRKVPDNVMWKEIEKETGYNHKIVWNDMVKTVKNKIMRLVPANDLLEKIPTEMQLTRSDWLLFDHILVHKQINVINTDTSDNVTSNKEEPQCLQELFELVKHFDIENLFGVRLMEAWARLTSQYNGRGRHCSPMMLQLRWYQMKTLARSCFYKNYNRTNNQDINKTEEPSAVIQLTVLQIEIAVAYNTVITKDWPSWETLISEKRVILAEEFSAAKPINYENKPNLSQAPDPLDEPMMLLIKFDENQMEDFDKIKNAEGSSTVADDRIVIDLKHDEELVAALQKVMDKTTDDVPTTPQMACNNPTDMENFKVQLVRQVAKMKMTNYLWNKFNETVLPKRDCKKIWTEMYSATARKIQKSLEANDVLQDISPSMRLSAVEWLLFDLVQVHQKVNCINYESLETKCIRDLFKLVVEYDVENLIGEKLAEAWINLTLKYNSGGRLCSPMLLQLRWHQLKEQTRHQVYNPFKHAYQRQSKLLISIAAKYQKIILQDLSPWTKLIKENRVILPEEFERALKQNNKWTEVEAREGWYLHVKKEVSDSEMNTSTTDTTDDVVCIVPDVSPPDIEEKLDEIVNQRLKDPTHQNKIVEIIDLDSDDEITNTSSGKPEKISDTLPETIKNTNNISKTHLESDASHKNVISDKSKNQVKVDLAVQKMITKPIITNNEPISCDSDDEMDKILQEKADIMSIELPENLKTLGKIIDEEIDDFNNMSSKIYGMEVEEIGIIKKEAVKAEEGLDEVDFDENNIEFADDGIKFEDGCEYTTKKLESTTDLSGGSDNGVDTDEETGTCDESDTDESNDNPEIDPKLLMDTKVCTKKIDRMEVFKFIDYDSLRDRRLIEHLETQNKPVRKHAQKNEDDKSRLQAFSGYDYDSVPSKPDVETPFQDQKATFEPPSISDKLTEDQNMKLAEHVRDLIAAITSDSQDESDSMANESPKIPVRSKVINLPDKDQIRLLNQSLLTAEITPTQPAITQPLLNLPTVNTINNNDNGTSEIICSLEESPSKRLKTDTGTSTTWSSNKPIYCCWAREKIVKTEENSDLECSKHMCIGNCCTCCCRVDLVTNNTKLISPHTTITPSPNINSVLTISGRVNNTSNTNVEGFSLLKDSLVNTKNIRNGPTDNHAFLKTNINHDVLDNTTSYISLLRNFETKEDNSLNKIPAKTKVINYTRDSVNSMIIRKEQCKKAKVNIPVAKPSTSHGHKVSVATMPTFRRILPNLSAQFGAQESGLPIKVLQKSGLPVKAPENLGLAVKGAQESGLPVKVLQKSGLPVKAPENLGLAVKGAQESGLPVKFLQKSGLPVKAPGNLGLAVKGAQESGLPVKVLQKSGLPVKAPGKLGFPVKGAQLTGLPVKGAQKSGLPVKVVKKSALPEITPKKLGPQKPLPTYVILPPGVNLVKLDNEVGLAINPGTELEPAQLQPLISLCASMNNSSVQISTPAEISPQLFSNS